MIMIIMEDKKRKTRDAYLQERKRKRKRVCYYNLRDFAGLLIGHAPMRIDSK